MTVTELISACKAPRVSSSEKSCSAHILFIADLRRARCLTFSFFLGRGTSKSRGPPSPPHPQQAKCSRQAPGCGREVEAPTTRVPAQVPGAAAATPQRPLGRRVRG